MPDPNKVTLDHADLHVTDAGDVVVRNPQVASVLRERLAGMKGPGVGAAADNYVGCGGNAYQCGGAAVHPLEQLVNAARTAKTGGVG